jgi:hypothetical protein
MTPARMVVGQYRFRAVTAIALLAALTAFGPVASAHAAAPTHAASTRTHPHPHPRPAPIAHPHPAPHPAPHPVWPRQRAGAWWPPA